MTALDPSSATRILEVPTAPFTSMAFGDLTMVPSGGGPHPVETTAVGRPAIPRDSDVTDVANLTTDDGGAIVDFEYTDSWTIMIALDQVDDLASAQQHINGPARMSLVTSATQAPYIIAGVTPPFASHDYTDPLPSGPVVFVLSASSTECYFGTSVEGVAEVKAGMADPSAQASSDAPLQIATGSDITSRLMGIWVWEEGALSQADAIDTAQAIAATLASPAFVTGSGAGGWGVSGSGLATVDAEPELPTIPTPPSGGSQTPPTKPTPATPSEMQSAGVYPLRHVYETTPAPTLVDGRPSGWSPSASGNAEYGYLQIVVEGVDITLLDGIETPFPSWQRGEPFGSQSATIQVPQITTFTTLPAWAAHGANVSIDLVKIGGGSVSLFEGFLMDLGVNEDTGVFTLECLGILFGADLTLRTPSFTTAPRDIGSLIPSLMNKAAGRRWLSMASVVTGARTAVAGGWEPLLTGYVQQLLATAIKDGRQWTVKCEERTPSLALKDTTTIEASIRVGQRGYRVDVNSDATQAPNVIFGEGIAPDGGRWRNAKYPNWKPDDTPDYPNASAANTMRLGDSDLGTDSGSGISDFQRKVGVSVTGHYSYSDVLAIKRFQKRAGITVDGIVGPQTWAALFNTGANTGTFDGAFIAPLTAAEEVMPRLYGPDGDDLGANPDYDPDIIRVEEKINYGQGVTKREGIDNAEQVLARESDPGWAGIITFELDPPGKSRYEIREGDNWRLLGLHDETVDLHTAMVRFDEDFAICEVDSKARDYPKLEAIRTRDRNAIDPAKVAHKRLLRGDAGTDRATYDAESPGGIMPRHAIFSGLWDVRKIPMGSYGRIVRTDFRTTNSAQPFALAVFGKPLTAADLVATVGNPLSATTNPWDSEELDDLGMLQAWGWSSQPSGYYPGTYSDPDGVGTDPVTGRLLDDASWDYASDQSPWLWVAAIAPTACFIEGRLYGAAD